MKRLIIFIIISVVGLVLGLSVLLYLRDNNNNYLSSEINLDKPVLYVVKPGRSLIGILKQWYSLGYADAVPPLLIRQLQLEQRSINIKAAHYQLRPAMTIDQAISMLVSGKAFEYRWRITEGTNIHQILSLLQNNKQVNYDLPKIDSRVDFAKLSSLLGLEKVNPEGLFFADTYNFFGNSKASTLLKKAAKRLDNVLDQEWQKKQENLPYTSPYQALIMASIIEKETGIAEERPRIAGVFTSRLKKGMRLQTDPTVIYGIGDSYDGNITKRHLSEKTAYNTYVIKGLPPTPIAAVGRAAINAALNPIEDGYLFFVARGDGSHAFSKTYSDHLKAVARFQLNRRSDYRSSQQ